MDYPAFRYTHNTDIFTQLGVELYFYGIALRYAPPPQAKSNAGTTIGKSVFP